MPRPPSSLSWLLITLILGGVVFAVGVIATDVHWAWWACGGFAGGALTGFVMLMSGHRAAVRAFEDSHRMSRPPDGPADPRAPGR